MLGTIIAYVVSAAMGLAVVYVLYNTFFSDWVEEKRQLWSESKTKSSNIDKIARIKLVSDNPKDIESFVTTNAQYLTVETVKKLVARIEDLQADRVISADSLRKRIDDLPQDEVTSSERMKAR